MTSQSMGWFIPGEVQIPSDSAYSISIVHAANSDMGEKMLEIVRANAGTGKKHMKNYTLREDLQVFFARKVNALFYTDTNQNTVIFTSKMELKHFHVLQMMILKYLPELFNDNPLTEKETALLKSLGNKSAAEYNEQGECC